MTLQRTRWTAALAAGSLALVLAGCGDDEPEVVEPGDAASSGAAGTGADDGSADSGDSGEQDELQPGEEIETEAFMTRLQSPGEEVLGSFQMEADMDLGGQGSMTITGAADLRGEEPAMDMEMTLPGMGELRILMVEGSVYMAVPGVTAEGKFAEISPDDLGMGNPLESFDMESTWDAWDEGTQTVEFVGTEDVDGEQMQHYALDVDTAAAMEAQGETSSPAGMPQTITYDVWVDSNDLMRKVTFDMGSMGGMTEGEVAMEMRIDDWGEEVDVQAPDPADLVDLELPGF